jgi:hypothetical protein
MKEELKQLYLNLSNVETKGQSTIIMANCLINLSKLIEKADESEDSQ